MSFLTNETDESKSPIYATLLNTATAFAHSTSPSQKTENQKEDAKHILSLRTPDCITSFGHRFFASGNPMTSRALSNDEFLANMGRMTPFLADWSAEVHDVLVDESRRSAVVRMSFHMTVKGANGAANETVENDMVWFLEMDESGQKVRRAVEYLDAAATGRIGALVAKVRETAA